MKRLLDPFEPTPDDFHRCIERKLNELQRAHTPVFRSRRWVIGFATCLVLLCSTALAFHQFGVLDFLATRIEGAWISLKKTSYSRSHKPATVPC